MPERVIKNKRKSRCNLCGEEITTDYKVKYKHYESDKRYKYYHLTCYYEWVIKTIKKLKIKLSTLNKSKRKLGRFNKYMILEKLG